MSLRVCVCVCAYRWESGQRLARKLLLKLYGVASSAGINSTDKAALSGALSEAGGVPQKLVEAYKTVLKDAVSNCSCQRSLFCVEARPTRFCIKQRALRMGL